MNISVVDDTNACFLPSVDDGFIGCQCAGFLLGLFFGDYDRSGRRGGGCNSGSGSSASSPIAPLTNKHVGAMVLYNGGEVLFELRTAPPSLSGKLAFPGGKWELGDNDLVRTAVREISEELGVTVSARAQSQCTYAGAGNHVSTYLASRPLDELERLSLSNRGALGQQLVWMTGPQLAALGAEALAPSARSMVAQLLSMHAWVFAVPATASATSAQHTLASGASSTTAATVVGPASGAKTPHGISGCFGGCCSSPR